MEGSLKTFMGDLNWLNHLPPMPAMLELLKCCGSRRWAERVTKSRPYKSETELKDIAHNIWFSLDRDDWLEAFRSHPKIGERKAEVSGTAETQQWSEQEQSGVAGSPDVVKEQLARLNLQYEEKFGYIFIVCATGKSSEEMLRLLEERLQNEPDDELRIAAAEQAKITELRLSKLLTL